jgi:hypothetical protein
MINLPSFVSQSTDTVNIIDKYAKFVLFKGEILIAKWDIPDYLRKELWSPWSSETHFYSTIDEKGFVYIYKTMNLPSNRQYMNYTLEKWTCVFVYSPLGELVDTMQLPHVYFRSMQILNSKFYILYPNYISIEDIDSLRKQNFETKDEIVIPRGVDGFNNDIPKYFEKFGFSEKSNNEILFNIPNSANNFIVLDSKNFILLSTRTLWFINQNGSVVSKVVLKHSTTEDKFCPGLDKVMYCDISRTGKDKIVLSYANSGYKSGFGCLLYDINGKYLNKYWNDANTVCVRNERGITCSIKKVTILPTSEIVVSLSGCGMFMVYSADGMHLLRMINVPHSKMLVAEPLILKNGLLLLATPDGFHLWK